MKQILIGGFVGILAVFITWISIGVFYRVFHSNQSNISNFQRVYTDLNSSKQDREDALPNMVYGSKDPKICLVKLNQILDIAKEKEVCICDVIEKHKVDIETACQ